MYVYGWHMVLVHEFYIINNITIKTFDDALLDSIKKQDVNNTLPSP